MTRTPRTPVQLHQDSRTLLYEFEMLCGTAAQLAGLDRKRQKIPYNSMIESFALHCRALIAFFFDHKPKYDSDVVAIDFFAAPDIWTSSQNISQFLVVVQAQAHKQIAHITTERRNLNTPEGKDGIWRISDIVQAICKLMADFLTSAPDHNFDPDAKQELIELVQRNYRLSMPVPGASNSNGNVWHPVQSKQQLSDVQATKTCITGKTSP